MFIEMKSRALDIDENLNIMRKIHIHNNVRVFWILRVDYHVYTSSRIATPGG